MSEGVSREVIPELPTERMHEVAAQVELEQQQEVEAWADLHEHATLPIRMLVGDGRSIPGRYCEPCKVLRMAAYELPFYEEPRRYFESWYVWVDVATVVIAALAVALLMR